MPKFIVHSVHQITLLAVLLAATVSAAAQEVAAAPAEARPAIATNNLLQAMFDGGPLMWPIAGSSIVLLVFVFERLVMLRRTRVLPKPFLQKFLVQLKGNQLSQDSAL